jgi:hypothetical protein
MPRVGFEHTIPVFERTMTVHSLGRAATVIGNKVSNNAKQIIRLHSHDCPSCVVHRVQAELRDVPRRSKAEINE